MLILCALSNNSMHSESYLSNKTHSNLLRLQYFISFCNLFTLHSIFILLIFHIGSAISMHRNSLLFLSCFSLWATPSIIHFLSCTWLRWVLIIISHALTSFILITVNAWSQTEYWFFEPAANIQLQSDVWFRMLLWSLSTQWVIAVDFLLQWVKENLMSHEEFNEPLVILLHCHYYEKIFQGIRGLQ